jgi:hypothetical protein
MKRHDLGIALIAVTLLPVAGRAEEVLIRGRGAHAERFLGRRISASEFRTCSEHILNVRTTDRIVDTEQRCDRGGGSGPHFK